MAKQMATRQGAKVRGKDPCAYCGEQLSATAGTFAFGRPGEYQMAWDGQRWVPYHRICWQQAQYQSRVHAST